MTSSPLQEETLLKLQHSVESEEKRWMQKLQKSTDELTQVSDNIHYACLNAGASFELCDVHSCCRRKKSCDK